MQKVSMDALELLLMEPQWREARSRRREICVRIGQDNILRFMVEIS